MKLTKDKYNEQNVRDKGNKTIMKFGFFMMLCCLLPIILVAGLPLLGIKSGVLSYLVFLLCPLMHIGMIFGMRKHHKENSCCKKGYTKSTEFERRE